MLRVVGRTHDPTPPTPRGPTRPACSSTPCGSARSVKPRPLLFIKRSVTSGSFSRNSMGPSPTTASDTSLTIWVRVPRGKMCRSSRRILRASSRTRRRRSARDTSARSRASTRRRSRSCNPRRTSVRTFGRITTLPRTPPGADPRGDPRLGPPCFSPARGGLDPGQRQHSSRAESRRWRPCRTRARRRPR